MEASYWRRLFRLHPKNLYFYRRFLTATYRRKVVPC